MDKTNINKEVREAIFNLMESINQLEDKMEALEGRLWRLENEKGKKGRTLT